MAEKSSNGTNPTEPSQAMDQFNKNDSCKLILELRQNRDEIVEIKKQLSEKAAIIGELEQKIQNGHKKFSELERQHQIAMDMVKRMNERKIDENSLEWLTLKMEAATKERDSYKLDFDRIEQINRNLKSDTLKLSADIGDLKKERANFQKAKTEIIENVDCMQKKMDKFELERTNVQKSIDTMNQIVQRSVASLKFYQKQNQEQDDQLKDLRLELFLCKDKLKEKCQNNDEKSESIVLQELKQQFEQVFINSQQDQDKILALRSCLLYSTTVIGKLNQLLREKQLADNNKSEVDSANIVVIEKAEDE